MDKVWWEQITNARRFIEEAVNTILEGNSVILTLPVHVPWYETMFERIVGRLSEENSNNKVDCCESPEKNVGGFLLERYCRKEKRAMYRSGISYAEFLAKSEDIVLNDRYVWVRRIPENLYEEWIDFLVEYKKNMTASKSPAVFILETQNADFQRKAKKGIKKISFDQTINAYDKFTFCTLSASGTSCREYLRPYLAELVSNVCSDDIELCAACIGAWKSFLNNPEQTIRSIEEESCRSDGTVFEDKDNKEKIERKIWESQLKFIFPLVEQYRSHFIKMHFRQLLQSLPIKDTFGELIDEPQGVEIGMLVYLVGNGKITVSSEEYAKLSLFKEARNKLAHLGILNFQMVEELLRWN